MGAALGRFLWKLLPRTPTILDQNCGALAQLGERLICIQEVRSSILLGSTKFPWERWLAVARQSDEKPFYIVLIRRSGLNRGMKICAITMVYRDYWALAQWIRHYSNNLGIENLYIVVHGPDERVNDIAGGANIWTIPRETLEGFDKRRNRMLNQFQFGLLQFYDWVIRTDTDELICVDPDLHGSLDRFLFQTTDDAVFATGLNVFEQADEQDMPDGISVFDCRDAAVITGNYSKAWAVKTNAPLMRHGVKLTNDSDKPYSFCFPQGVYLAHLKFANIAALAEMNVTRKEVARAGVPGLPGWGWKRADAHTRKFFKEAETLDFTSWSDAVAYAHERIPTDMKYDEKDGVIRSPGIPYLAKTRLPKWFKDI